MLAATKNIQLWFGKKLTPTDLKDAPYLVSKKNHIAAVQLPEAGFVNTLWDTKQHQNKAGDFLSFYGAEQDSETGEYKADINIIDQATFRTTYGENGEAFGDDTEFPKAKPFKAIKLEVPYKVGFTAPENTVDTLECKDATPTSGIVLLDKNGNFHTPTAEKIIDKYKAVTQQNLTFEDTPFTNEEIQASEQAFAEIGKRINIAA